MFVLEYAHQSALCFQKMNNLKVIILAAIILLFIIAGAYWVYQTQVSNVSLAPSPKASPVGNLKSATPSATVEATKAASTNPATGPEDSLNLQTQIQITSPQQGSYISSPLHVQGFANITSQTVEINVKDADGNILGSARASACIGYTSCKFSANVIFSNPQTSTGTIMAYSRSTIDGSPTDTTTLDINF